MPRVNKILGDLTELKKAVKNLTAEYKEAAECLLVETSFLHSTLEKLKEQINNDGPVIKIKRGQSEIIKENPALKTYNVSIMRYSQLIKQLTDILPEPPKEPVKDELLEFINPS